MDVLMNILSRNLYHGIDQPSYHSVGANSVSPWTRPGCAAARRSARIAPIERPPTTIVVQRSSRAASAVSTDLYQSGHLLARRSASLPQWPASWQHRTVDPRADSPRAIDLSSSGVPPSPWTSRTPTRLPAQNRLRSTPPMRPPIVTL